MTDICHQTPGRSLLTSEPITEPIKGLKEFFLRSKAQLAKRKRQNAPTTRRPTPARGEGVPQLFVQLTTLFLHRGVPRNKQRPDPVRQRGAAPRAGCVSREREATTGRAPRRGRAARSARGAAPRPARAASRRPGRRGAAPEPGPGRLTPRAGPALTFKRLDVAMIPPPARPPRRRRLLSPGWARLGSPPAAAALHGRGPPARPARPAAAAVAAAAAPGSPARRRGRHRARGARRRDRLAPPHAAAPQSLMAASAQEALGSSPGSMEGAGPHDAAPPSRPRRRARREARAGAPPAAPPGGRLRESSPI